MTLALAALAVACGHEARPVARVALPPPAPAPRSTVCEGKARAAAIQAASACWREWGVDEPKELLLAMTTADGARVCLTPKARKNTASPFGGCQSPLDWSVQLTTKAGETVSRDVTIAPEHVALFDFDGDGVQELVVSGYGVEIVRLRAGLDEMPTLPARPSWIGPAAPKLPRATSVRDVDGDGRPDLIFDGFFEVALYDWDTDTYRITGPPVAARSRPDGTFSFEDRVAVDRLHRACERVPTLAHAELRGLFASAVCARLGGAPLATTEAEYRARCHDQQPPKGVYSGDYFAMCKRGETADVLTDDIPTPVHDWLTAISTPPVLR